MKTSDRPLFAALMNALSELYGKESSKILSEIYWNTLKQFKWVAIEKAVKRYIADPEEGKFMPKPGDIVRWIVGSSETRALQAWAKVMEGMQRIGSHESVVFEDLTIHCAVDAIGGWVKLGMTKTDRLPLVAQDFKKYYIAFLKDPPDEFPTHLLGRMPSGQPVLIGNKKLSREEAQDTALLDVTLKKLEPMHG
jgi:hypothetical protein